MASADMTASPTIDSEGSMSAGEFVLKKLFAEFVVLSEKKLQDIASQPADYQLAKALQKGEDPHFDQLLNSLNEVASFCLRSILTSIFKWRDMQIQQCRSHTSWSTVPSGDATDSPFPVSKREKDHLTERQELAIDFIFCLVLIEVLTKLSVHPVPESFIHTIEDYAFKHFKQQEALKDRTSTNPNIQSMKKIADLYAEVIGVLSQSRFHSVRRRFFHEIRDPQNNSSTIISIIEGMSFIRVKMFPVDELEQWFAFLQECASFFLDSSREKIKHAMCALLVEILLPVASVIKFEASLPVVRKFVNMLYNHCFEYAKRGKHSTAYIPLVTVLLAISEQQFFLNHWHGFLIQIIMHNIRRGDNKVQRTALEALNRLVWVYMVRIKGESNTLTINRVKSVLEVLFPKGQRGVQPKDMPLNIFVKLIQFISRERLEYGMYEILELLNHGRTKNTINPERMNIALRAFLIIADSLEKKEGDPPMPLNVGPLPSGGPQRVKTKYLSTTLTDETAKKIGIKEFYPKIRTALDGMLRALDVSVGKTFISTNSQNMSRSEEEVLSPVKPKLDLLKTCIAAIPRIMPADMTRDDLIDLLSRLTIHMDHELVRTAFTSLQNIITNFPSWRHHVTKIFSLFILRDIPDSCPLVLEAALKMLIQMVTHWKSLIGSDPQSPSGSAPSSPLKQPGVLNRGTKNATSISKTNTNSNISAPPLATPLGGQGQDKGDQREEGGEMYYCVPWVEACGLVTMCSYRSVTRRVSLILLKEIRSLHTALQIESEQATCTVMDVIEKSMPVIIKRYLATLTLKERNELRMAHQNLNIYWMADRTSCFLEQGGSRDSLRDAWAQCLAGLLEPQLLPEVCPTSIHIAWPYAYHRMCKAYAILDPGFVAHEKADRPPSLKGRRPVMSTVEMFLWRNYLIFLSCTAPPSTSLQASLMSSGDSTVLEGSGRYQLELNARNLFHKVVPFIRMDGGEIREVAITALGMVHPNAFGDLVEELHVVIHDSLDQRKGDNPRKRRRRESLRVQITRVFALTADHGCFQQSPMTRTEKGDVTTVFLEFIEGIKNCLEAEHDRLMPYLQELRLYFATFISNIINSLPQGKDRFRLFSPEMRYSLFYVFANWCDLFGIVLSDSEPDIRRSHRLSLNSLLAMSALLCCGPVFHANCLDKDSRIYRWLENMLSSEESKVHTLGRKTLQMLLQNNINSTLLDWVIDRCYYSKPICAQLCFHALCNTLASNPKYPCDMVTILHLVLYKTADLEYTTRERSIHLLQILDRRYFATSIEGLAGRSELLGCLKGGAYSQCHVGLSRELALANPELTLPMFCEMVLRFEMSSISGKRSLLQYMVPWLQNVELVEESPPSQPHVVHSEEYISEEVVGSGGNPVLKGSGWGSPEGTKVVLHNLLYITTKYGDEYSKEVESLWCALCTWTHNIRVTINYLARLTYVVGNMSLMLKQAKRIVVCFSRSQAHCIVNELISDLNLVDLISLDLTATEQPPYYSFTSPQGTRRFERRSEDTAAVTETIPSLPEGMEGTGWAIVWRVLFRKFEGNPLPLPNPKAKRYFSSFKDMFRRVQQQQLQQVPFHRCNFSLILLSELIMELQEVDWSPFLPLLLHTVLLGLDWFRPLVYEHSKKILGSLIVVLACRNNKTAALQARFVQQEVTLRAPSFSSLGSDADHANIFTAKHSFSDESLHPTSELFQTSLSSEAKELIHFVSMQESHRPPWPFSDLNLNRTNPNGEVAELSSLVGKILVVFDHVYIPRLKERWANIALHWSTSCSSHQYASQSFQVCRALQLPLSSPMFREVLTRLAESVSEEKEDMQSYVSEIVMTLESAVNHMEEEDPVQPAKSTSLISTALSLPQPLPQQQLKPLPQRKHSDVSPLLSDTDGPSSPAPNSSQETEMSGSGSPGAPYKRKHSRGRSVTSKSEMMSRPNSAKMGMDFNPQEGKDVLATSNKPTSPPRVTSPTHHKSPTVSGTHLSFEKESTISIPTRPHSSYLASCVIPENSPESDGKTPLTSVTAVSQQDVSQLSPSTGSPLKPSPDTPAIENTSLLVQTLPPDEGASSSSASAPDTREGKSMKHKESSSASLMTSFGEKSQKPEPPLSLQALFSRDSIGSSRRWTNRQFSVDELTNSHLKQHSFDSTRLQSSTPQSPKYLRRVRSPSMLDKNIKSDSGLDSEDQTGKKVKEKLHRTPSHPHLNSAISNPQVSHSASILTMENQPIARARSTQQLKLEADNEETAQIVCSRSGSNTDLVKSSSEKPGTSGLKLIKDREISQSKESLNSCKDTVFNSGLKKTASRESLKGKESSSNFSKVIQTPVNESNISTTSLTMPSRDLNKENRERSAPSKDTQSGAEGSIENTQAPLFNQQLFLPKHGADIKHRRSLYITQRQDVPVVKKDRPSSMIDMSSLSYQQTASFQAEVNPGAPELLAQLFWTGASLLESDYYGEYILAMRLLAKVFDHLDLTLNNTYVCLEKLLDKMDWNPFPGVQNLLLKGLTHDLTSEPARELLSRVTLFSTRAVFDPTQYAGLPLNIMALMPVLVDNFNQPTQFCIKVVSNIQQACTSVDLPSEECKTKMGHMSKMFQMYATKEFINGCDIWLAGICRYLNDAYASLAVEVLSLLVEMLEKGSPSYHQPVLKLLCEYLKLQNPNSREIKKMADTVMTVATQHIKGHLWKEALSLLTLAVSNSASLVQPPTRGLPVDLGLFNQTLPGPTLQFTMDLHHGSTDLKLANAPVVSSSWKQPQACQRRTRERLISVLNACGPGVGLMSSPSVVFTDDQALLADKGTLYSSTSEEAASSIASVNHDDILESSQPESQSYINAVGEQFNFLDNFEYMYEQSSSEGETPGPFSRSFQVLETEEREEDRDSSPLGSLRGSRISLVEDGNGQLDEFSESLRGISSPARMITPELPDYSTSPEKSPDVPIKSRDIRMLTPERPSVVVCTKSPDMARRFDSPMKLRSPDLRLRMLPQLKEDSPESFVEELETPKQSPERDIEETMDRDEKGESEGEISNVLSEESTPEYKGKSPGLTPPKEDDLPPPGEGMAVIRSDSFEKEQSPQQLSNMELSYKKASKLPENTISLENSTKTHFKELSEDSVSNQFSRASNPPLTGHTKAASDGVTIAKHVSPVSNQSSRASNSPLIGHNKVASDGVTIAKHVSPVSNQSSKASNSPLIGHNKAASDDVTIAKHVSPVSNQSSRISNPPLTGHNKAASDDVTIAKHVSPVSRIESLSLTRMDRVGAREGVHNFAHVALDNGVKDKKGKMATTEDHALPQDTNLEETTISPRLKIVEKSDKDPSSNQWVGEEALFEMLQGLEEVPVSDQIPGDERQIDKREVLEEVDVSDDPNPDECPTSANPASTLAKEEEPVSANPASTLAKEEEPVSVDPTSALAKEEELVAMDSTSALDRIRVEGVAVMKPLALQKAPVGTKSLTLSKREEGLLEDSDRTTEEIVSGMQSHDQGKESPDHESLGVDQHDVKSHDHDKESPDQSLNTDGHFGKLHDQSQESPYHDPSIDMNQRQDDESHDGDGESPDNTKRSSDIYQPCNANESSPDHSEGRILNREMSGGDTDVIDSSLDQNSQLRESRESPMDDTPSQWLVPSSQLELEASKFIDFDDIEEIEDAWYGHVTDLSQQMSARIAVNTYFLFDRLFSMIRSQFCHLTREACNYLGEDYKTIASHFLVTTEFLLSQFQLPKIYIDAEMIKRAGILEQHIFLVLELHNSLSTYKEKRKTVLKSLSEFKLALRQQSEDTPSPGSGALELCRAVHRFHFQLLVLLGSYVKLVTMLQHPMETTSPMSELKGELTDLIQGCNEAVLSLTRGSSPPLDNHSYSEIEQLQSMADAVSALEDTLSQRQYLKAVQLLHTMRKQWKGEEILGTVEDDDVDCLFFIYATYVADGQGMLCITNTEHKLSDVHARLMAQNVSLHSLLEKAQLSHDSNTPPLHRQRHQKPTERS